MYSCPALHVISFSEKGGINKPKHFGQSGQPIPEPVILTKPPAKTIRYVKNKANLAILIKSLEDVMKFSYFFDAQHALVQPLCPGFIWEIEVFFLLEPQEVTFRPVF